MGNEDFWPWSAGVSPASFERAIGNFAGETPALQGELTDAIGFYTWSIRAAR
jgi:hypothetical protein